MKFLPLLRGPHTDELGIKLSHVPADGQAVKQYAYLLADLYTRLAVVWPALCRAVLAVEVADRPGGLAEVLAVFEGTDINIEYMYAVPFARREKAVLIFRFDNPDAAIQVLQSAGINVLESGEVCGR